MKHFESPVHGDGTLTQQDLKQIITKIGVHISVAEAMFIYRYLEGLGEGGCCHVEHVQAAVLAHKPTKKAVNTLRNTN